MVEPQRMKPLVDRGALSTVTDVDFAARLRPQRRPREAVIESGLFVAALVSVLTTAGIIYVLGYEALRFFLLPQVTLTEFVTGTVWQPSIDQFGVMPLVSATLLTSMIGMLVALQKKNARGGTKQWQDSHYREIFIMARVRWKR